MATDPFCLQHSGDSVDQVKKEKNILTLRQVGLTYNLQSVLWCLYVQMHVCVCECFTWS